MASKKSIVLISNSFGSLYNFRYELILSLLKEYQVTLMTPMELEDQAHFEDFKKNGCELVETQLKRRGKNPFSDLQLRNTYLKQLRKIHPDLVITYTIKPNIYAGMACSKLQIPYFTNVTGLGRAFQKNGLLKKITIKLFQNGVKHADLIFFQNEESQLVFEQNKIGNGKFRLVPGSGINLDKFGQKAYHKEWENTFLYIARIMKEKGADEFFEAAQRMKQKYPDVQFLVVGMCEESYEEKIKQLQENQTIIFCGWQENIPKYMEQAGCIVNPSYHEGMSNVCLEAAATGRPVIASDIPGCRETVLDTKSGFLCPVANADALYECMEKFYHLSVEQKEQMGKEGRLLMEKVFDRKLVTAKYQEEIKRIVN